MSYSLAAKEARQIANGGAPMTTEEIVKEMQEALVVSVKSMRLAIATVEYSNRIHVLLDTHVYSSTLRAEPPAVRTVFYSDLTDIKLTERQMRAFANHVHNIFMKTKKYNDKQVSSSLL